MQKTRFRPSRTQVAILAVLGAVGGAASVIGYMLSIEVPTGVRLAVDALVLALLILLAWTARSIRRAETQRRRLEDRERRTGEALRRSETVYRTLVEHLPGTVVTVVDRDLRYELVGGYANETGGWRRTDLEGRSVREIVSQEHVEQVEKHYRGALAGEPGSFDLAKNGRFFWIQVLPVRGDGGEVLAAIAVSQEITERKRAEEAIASARDEALETSRMKSAFVANMSHEVRTPLNGVLGMTGLLLGTKLTDEQREYAEMAQRSGDALLKVTNDVLDLSKIEAGKLELEPIDFDPVETVEGACALLADGARSRAIDLVVDVEADVPRAVRGDEGRLRQVIINLVSNAVKFTHEGGVAVRVERLDRDGERQGVRLEVTDSGIGINPAELERLFEPFNQADSSTTRRYGGTGLGLSISRQLVELMGGQIGAESAPGRGSTFWFSVPLERGPAGTTDEALGIPFASTGPAVHAQRPPAAVHGEVPLILVAEDDAVSRALIVRLLELRGCRVHAVTDGRAAVEACSRKRYAAVLMDGQMPELDGYAATAQIRRRETSGQRMPIVAITASSMKGDRDRCLAAGMDGYLSKPLRPAELDAVLGDLLRGPSTTATIVDLSELRRLEEGLGPDEGARLVAELIPLFMSETAERLAALEDAIAARDAEAAGSVAHKLRGSSASMGATRMAELCAKAEELAERSELDAVSGLLPELLECFDLTRSRLASTVEGEGRSDRSRKYPATARANASALASQGKSA